MPNAASPLLIIGASARAAAASAARAGWQPFAVDQFADLDLQALAHVISCVEFPAGLPVACEPLPTMPWLYVGGLENYPTIVEQLKAQRPLLGNASETLRQIREPKNLTAICAACEIPFPEMRPELSPTDDATAWLWKGIASSAGLQVYKAARHPVGQVGYFQRHQPGIPMSAAFVANGQRAELLGITQQLIGHNFHAPRAFQYAGNIAPLKIPPECEQRLRTLGDKLTAEFGLQGLWGFDFLLAGEAMFALEVNPRYCASMELLERAFSLSMLAVHVAACTRGELPQHHQLKSLTAAPRMFGKLIVYAPHTGEFAAETVSQFLQANAANPWPTVADISPAGTQFPAGAPLVTVFAEGGSVVEVQTRLLQTREEILATFAAAK
jgi:predicted ATP-grasp superfamily ATP-dependent carboligase